MYKLNYAVSALLMGAFTVFSNPQAIEKEEPVYDIVQCQNEEARQELYSVNGAMLNPELQAYLKSKLDSAGIGWWFKYALCQAYQESRFDIYAINQTNHEDMGLFQFKNRHWSEVCARCGRVGSDIFDPYAQIDVYACQVAERLQNRYNDIWYAISDHYTGSYGYSQEYVNDVIQWLWTVKEV